MQSITASDRTMDRRPSPQATTSHEEPTRKAVTANIARKSTNRPAHAPTHTTTPSGVDSARTKAIPDTGAPGNISNPRIGPHATCTKQGPHTKNIKTTPTTG